MHLFRTLLPMSTPGNHTALTSFNSARLSKTHSTPSPSAPLPSLSGPSGLSGVIQPSPQARLPASSQKRDQLAVMKASPRFDKYPPSQGKDTPPPPSPPSRGRPTRRTYVRSTSPSSSSKQRAQQNAPLTRPDLSSRQVRERRPSSTPSSSSSSSHSLSSISTRPPTPPPKDRPVLPAAKLVHRRPPHNGSPRYPRSPPFETWSSFVPPKHVASSSSEEDGFGCAIPSPSPPLTPFLPNAEYDKAVALTLSQDMDPPPRPLPRDEQDRSTACAHSPSPSPVQCHLSTTSHSLSRSPLASRAGPPLPSTPSRSSSSLPVPSRSPSPRPTYLCTICQDEIDGAIIHLSCGHLFDTSCLRTMFENATKDESLFPPKCCLTTIDIDTVQMDLGAPLVEQYKRKSREFKTKDRVYCHNPTCSAFLGDATAMAAALRCTECHSETCGSCKDAAHDGQTCDARHDETMLEFAKGQGWQRCPSCKHLVELTEGCFHMTCRCEKQFCYLCAAVWKTCECPLFHVPDEEPAATQTAA